MTYMAQGTDITLIYLKFSPKQYSGKVCHFSEEPCVPHFKANPQTEARCNKQEKKKTKQTPAQIAPDMLKCQGCPPSQDVPFYMVPITTHTRYIRDLYV